LWIKLIFYCFNDFHILKKKKKKKKTANTITLGGNYYI